MLTVFILNLLIFINITSENTILVLEGNYLGKSVYIQNSLLSQSTSTYCIQEITVNGITYPGNLKSNALQIDFDLLGIALSEKVKIEIKHVDYCLPQVVNPEVLMVAPTFQLVNSKVDAAGILSFSTKNETGSLDFIVEQFKWNKWVEIDKIKGSGLPTLTNYQIKVDLVSGENKFRLKQQSKSGKTLLSPEFSFVSLTPPIQFKIDRRKKKIVFDRRTQFELYNTYGKKIQKGFAEEIDINRIPKGNYIINYDNTFKEFKK